MQKYTKKIGWQKYEDFIEKQFSSPLLNTVIQNFAMQNLTLEDDEESEEEYLAEEEKDTSHLNMMLPITRQLIEDITMLSNFDCWIAHTNFDITQKIKDKLNSTPGIELLKICSRYRFFIGIGQMFDFKEVRSKIEESLIKGD